MAFSFILAPRFQPCAKAGGGERDRTDDLLRAKQVLSQLSYTPKVRRFAIDGYRMYAYTEPVVTLKVINHQSRWWA